MPIEPGQTLLHYRLIEKIGEGGMGVVWRAADTRLDREVAVKILPDHVAGDASRLARFEREAKAVAALNHPNIVTVHAIEQDGDTRFITMELVRGVSLREHIPQGGLSVERVLELAIPLVDALAKAHAGGITHRDLKPDNVMLDEDGRVKILDFGLAKVAGNPEAATDDAPTATRTGAGVVMGTARYMSPEQAQGKPADERSDIFSLGVMLFEMATGERPFKGDNPMSILSSIIKDPAPSLIDVKPVQPRQLGRIIARCLEKEPERRFQKARSLGTELENLAAEIGGGGAAVAERAAESSGGPASRRGLLVAGAAVVLLLIAVGVWQARDSEAPGYPSAEAPAVSGLKIAVLPFANASGDEQQRYFSDGLTRDIVTELSRFGELAVMPCSSGPCEKSNPDAREVGGALGVRYVLQGQVQSSSERIRVNVQLHDGRDGRSVWGESFDSERTARDLFELQDELTEQVVSQIAGSSGVLARTELPRGRRKPPASLDSYDCVFRVYEYLQSHTAENHLAARACMERVVEAEPDYVTGLAWLAYLYADQYHHRWNEPRGEYDSVERAVRRGERAVELDGGDQLARANLGFALLFAGDTARALPEMRRAAAMNPNNPIVMSLLSNYLAYQGEFETAVAMATRAIELNPHPPEYSDMPMFVDHYFHGRYEQALVHSLGGIVAGPDFREPMFLAATLGQLGRVEEAAPALAELRELWAELCKKAGCEGLDIADVRRELIERHAFSPTLTDKLIDGLAKAGLKEAQRGQV